MFRRLSRLQIPLATKCQLLFGIAAGIIILAALIVTWQRIEQLTRQQDSVSAETLAKQTLAAHAATGEPPPTDPPFAQMDGLTVRRPRLTGISDEDALTPFEQRALNRFRRERMLGGYGETHATEEDRVGYLFALPARAGASCLSCHGGTTQAGQALTVPQGVTTAPVRLPDAPALDRRDLDTTESDTDEEEMLPLVLAPDELTAEEDEAAEDEPGGEASEASIGHLMGLVSVEIPSQIRSRQRLLNRVFLISASLAAAATAAVTLYLILTRLILTPVRVLQETAEKVQGGDLTVRSTIASGDEFQTLSETFNAMLSVVQQRNEQLARANRSLDSKLDQLSVTNVALDESNRLKSEFLANVSHELRTPLNSILGFADLLKQVGRDDPKVQRYANNIHASGHSLLVLINDLLDLAKIEAGRMELRPAALSIPDLLEALLTLVAPLAQKRKLHIETRIIPQVPIVETDPGKLQQILYNLLSNALKFSPEGGRIIIEARRENPDQVRLSVIDQGPGVPLDKQQMIFEKFRQLDEGVTRQHGGSGLGLSISRDLAHLLGGELGVESTPGHGATFWLTLPLKLQARRHEKSPPSPDEQRRS